MELIKNMTLTNLDAYWVLEHHVLNTNKTPDSLKDIESNLMPLINALKDASQEDRDFFMHMAAVNPLRISLWATNIKSQEDLNNKLSDWKQRGFINKTK